ncbi:DUF1566 domain-containing protein [Psychromonas sp.]|nr:DUF1566 domain-containing protein [Psychromonas sp.]
MIVSKKFLIPKLVLLGALGSLAGCSSEDTVDSVTDSDSDSESVETSVTYSYPIVDTNQGLCYDGTSRLDECPAEGEAFYGQDAQYTATTPSYTDNGDGSINDNVTGLVWTQAISTYAMPWSDAATYCGTLETANLTSWRLPSLKELWSIRDFSQGVPWVDTDYFYLVGDGSDLAQHHSWSSDPYLVESPYQDEQVEGDPAWIVNDWTGHIKAMSGSRFVRCVIGDEYGVNDFVDNGDSTITDNATGLMWMQDDSGEAMYWEDALAYAESATIAGYDDWRLPSIKELQSIADNSVTEIPAMDTSVFNLTEVENIVYDPDTLEQIDTQVNYPFYWSNTSNPIEDDSEDVDGGTLYGWVYASGYNVSLLGYDLHGAGSIVFVSKTLENSGIEDSVPILVRLVRGGDVTETPEGDSSTINLDRVVVFEDGIVSSGGGSDVAEEESTGLDFSIGVAYLESLEINVTSDELIVLIGGPPAPTAAEVVSNFAASSLTITEDQVLELLETLNLE